MARRLFHSDGNEDLRMKYGFLIDMDGVLYRGSQLIPGAGTEISAAAELP